MDEEINKEFYQELLILTYQKLMQNKKLLGTEAGKRMLKRCHLELEPKNLEFLRALGKKHCVFERDDEVVLISLEGKAFDEFGEPRKMLKTMSKKEYAKFKLKSR